MEATKYCRMLDDSTAMRASYICNGEAQCEKRNAKHHAVQDSVKLWQWWDLLNKC